VSSAQAQAQLERQFVSADIAKCIGCGLCELACVIQNERSLNVAKSRIKVIHMTPLACTAVACRFCEDAPCVRACPRNALSQSEQTGVILVDDERCDLCGWCVEACPYGAIVVDPERNTVLICDLCGEEEPKCVEFCPTEALSLSTEEELRKKTFSSMASLFSEVRQVIDRGAWQHLFAKAVDIGRKVEEKFKELARWAWELGVYPEGGARGA